MEQASTDGQRQKEIMISKKGGHCEEVLRIGRKVVVHLLMIGHKYGKLHLVISGVMQHLIVVSINEILYLLINSID